MFKPYERQCFLWEIYTGFKSYSSTITHELLYIFTNMGGVL